MSGGVLRRLRRRAAGRRGQAGFIEAGVAATGLALVLGAALGSGVASTVVSMSDGVTWLPDDSTGQVVQVNPVTGVAERRLQVAPAGSPLVVHQRDGRLVVDDGRSGVVTSIDLATLLAAGQRDAGAGSIVLVGGGQVFLVSSSGVVRAVDPLTLQDLGTPFRTGGLAHAVVDEQGTVWAVGTDGTLHELAWDESRGAVVERRARPLRGAGATTRLLPHARGVTVFAADGGVVAQVGAGRDLAVVAPALDGVAVPAALSPSDLAPAAVPGSGRVLMISGGDLLVVDVAALGCARPGAPAVLAERVYVPCTGTGHVVVLGADGRRAAPDVIVPGGRDPEVLVDDGRVVVTSESPDEVVVVERDGTTRTVRTGGAGTPVVDVNAPPAAVPPPARPTPPAAPRDVVPDVQPDLPGASTGTPAAPRVEQPPRTPGGTPDVPDVPDRSEVPVPPGTTPPPGTVVPPGTTPGEPGDPTGPPGAGTPTVPAPDPTVPGPDPADPDPADPLPDPDPVPDPDLTPPPPATPPPAPVAPGSVQAAAAGPGEATVSWTATGPTPDGYVVRAVGGGPAPVSVGGDRTTATVAGIACGTRPTFTVEAVLGDEVARSAPSAPVTAAPCPPTAPTAATGVGASAAGDGSVTVSWTPASSGADAYVVAPEGGSGTQVDGAATSVVLRDVPAGAGVRFVVQTRLGGAVAQSAPSNAVTVAGPPGAPGAVSASLAGRSGDSLSVALSFSAAAENGSPVTSYTAHWSGGGVSGSAGVPAGGTTLAVGCAGRELCTAGGTLQVTVVARNGVGDGPGGSGAVTVPAPPPPPPAAGDVVVTALDASAPGTYDSEIPMTAYLSPPATWRQHAGGCRIVVDGSATPIACDHSGAVPVGSYPQYTYVSVHVEALDVAGAVVASATVTAQVPARNTWGQCDPVTGICTQPVSTPLTDADVVVVPLPWTPLPGVPGGPEPAPVLLAGVAFLGLAGALRAARSTGRRPGTAADPDRRPDPLPPAVPTTEEPAR